eukprot:gene15049-16602_t
MADINYIGVGGIVVFYLLILFLGIWAGRKKSAPREGEPEGEHHDQTKEIMLAGRNIGMFVGAFTMTATWVGGGYINGTAEVVYTSGVAWAQSSWGYSLSLCLGGFLFAKIMRKRNYITMLDPFQDRYGVRIGGLMYVPAFLGELIWSAATLNSLGATISVALELPYAYSIVVSACIAVFYTFLGGLWSVAYTDVAQLICMFIGMWLTIPFALTHEAVAPISQTTAKWASGASWKWDRFGIWMDNAFLFIFGGIPWQVYFQRVLSSKSYKRAQYLSFYASIGCVIMAVPSIIIGAIGASTDWTQTKYWSKAINFNKTENTIKPEFTMPLVLQYLTPEWVSFIGLGAVSAAVMSSVDSSVLSASSMFAHNIYRTIFRQRASEREIIWVIRVSIIIIGTISACIGIEVNTVYGLSYLCSDFIFVVLFPELLCVLYFRYANTYGAMFGYVVGFLLRLLSGEPLFRLQAVIRYPYYFFDDKGLVRQKFPFRILLMCVTLISIVVGSLAARAIFKLGLNRKYDVTGDFQDEIDDVEIKKMFDFKGITVKTNYDKVTIDNGAALNSHEMKENPKS